jgi:hypothetical protein
MRRLCSRLRTRRKACLRLLALVIEFANPLFQTVAETCYLSEGLSTMPDSDLIQSAVSSRPVAVSTT